MSTSMVNSVPGIGSGVRRPFASGAPSCVRTHSRPVTTPFGPRTRTGCVCQRKATRVLLGELVFVGEGRHFRLAAAVNQIDGFGAKPPRGGDHVNGGVARADAGDAAADFDFVRTAALLFSR